MPMDTTNRTLELIKSMGPKTFDQTVLPWGSRAPISAPGIPSWMSGAAKGVGRLAGGLPGLAATAAPAFWGSLDDSHFPDIKAKRDAGAAVRRKAFEGAFRGNTSPEELAAAKRDNMFATGTDAQDRQPQGAPAPPPFEGPTYGGPADGFVGPTSGGPAVGPPMDIVPPWMRQPGREVPPAGAFGAAPQEAAAPSAPTQPSFFEGFMGRLSKAGAKPDAALVPKLAHLFYGG